MSGDWISVKNALPPMYKMVQCIGARGGTFKGKRTTSYFDGNTVWMKTPGNPWGEEATHWKLIKELKKQ